MLYLKDERVCNYIEMNVCEKISKTLTFTREKDTKNTIRYQEVRDGSDVVIGPLYIQKHFLPKIIPTNLRITVTIDGEGE